MPGRPRKNWIDIIRRDLKDTDTTWDESEELATDRAQGPNLQNFVESTFVTLSYLFRMSANKLSYEEFTKELRKNYERDTKEIRMNYECLQISGCKQNGAYVNSEYKIK